LITVTKGINEPRIPGFSDLAEAMEKEVQVWSSQDLDVDPKRLGLDGSPTWVMKIWTPESMRTGEVVQVEPGEAAKKMIHFLEEKGIL
jgi:electron transfer flavoprotein beta subunit